MSRNKPGRKRVLSLPLRDLRESCGIPVEYVAAKVGVSNRAFAVSEWRGIHDLERLYQLADIYGVDPELVIKASRKTLNADQKRYAACVEIA